MDGVVGCCLVEVVVGYVLAVLSVASPTLVVASSQAGVNLENRHLLFVREYIHHK